MDLTTTYMGLKLQNPLVASASPLTREVKNIAALAEAGAGAIVFHSIFQEQLGEEARSINFYLEQGTERFWESPTYFPPLRQVMGPETYLNNIAAAKKQVNVPIIASLNCFSVSGWVSFARDVQEAGADAIELNPYFIPTSPAISGADVEGGYLSILEAVRAAVTIPVAVKLSPYFSATAAMATRLDKAGANALVLFNRFYQPDIDLENLSVEPRLVLSRSEDARLPMRWIAILFGKLKASLAATSGVHTGLDAAKLILAGADAVMMCSALLENGIGHMTRVRQEMSELLEAKGYESIAQARGVLSQRTCEDPSAFERANYMKTLHSYNQPWESV